VPDASALLFSVKAAAQNGYSTIFNEKKKLLFANVMELLQDRLSWLMTSKYWLFGCIPLHVAEST
jgi:hypothetical protein